MEKLWETVAGAHCPLDRLFSFGDDVVAQELVVVNYAERANDIVRAVHLLQQHGMPVGFPMQTADGEMIFAVGKDFTLTADQILDLLERGELHADGVRKLQQIKVLPYLHGP